MSATEHKHDELAAGRLIDAIGPQRFLRLHDALAGASREEASTVLGIISDAIDTQDRVLEQLREIHSFMRGIAMTGIPAREAATPPEQPVSAQ